MELTCTICGKKFERKPRGGHVPTICGSKECVRQRHSQSVREHRWRQRGGSTTQVRTCLECGSSFEFIRTEGTLGAGPNFCSDVCREKRARERARLATAAHRLRLPAEVKAISRRAALLARYGLTPETYALLVEAQNGVCAICKQPETKHHSLLLKIDHDRSCCAGSRSCGRCVRGLLCSNCNRGLGLFQDNKEILHAAAEYLERVAPG